MEVFGHARRIYLGPQAQEVLRPWLRTDPTACLFQPKEAVAEFRASRPPGRSRRARSQPRLPRSKGRKDRPGVGPGERYSAQSYGQAIRYGIAKANREAEKTGGARIPWWHPHQLRHSAATRLRREFGLDVARAVLGQRSLASAHIYAELDRAGAVEAMARIG
jgi:integrase